MTLAFVRGYALAVGILIPAFETVRRWGRAFGPFWLDDYLVGAFLLFGWWQSRRPGGLPALAAAWAFACGIGYMSFFSHLEIISQPEIGPVPHVAFIVIQGIGLGLAVFSLVVSLRASRRAERS